MAYTITVADNISSGLTYFAWIGAAKMVKALSRGPVRMWWSPRSRPCGEIQTTDVSLEDLAEGIKQHATRWAESWTAVRVHYAEGTFSPFSPRFKQIDPIKHAEDWEKHQTARNAALDALERDNDRLALELIQGLGEAAYWRFERKDPRPDHGASRWEMITRTGGKEFVQSRFHPMCVELSKWEIDDIVAGISGAQINDAVGTGKSASRASTGLTPPGPADTALVFLGLLGLSVFPPLHRIGAISVTPCAFPDNALHPTRAIFPVPVRPMSLERLQCIILSNQWAAIAKELGNEHSARNMDADYGAARLLGVPAAVQFRIHKGGSSTAPERFFERGEVVLFP